MSDYLEFRECAGCGELFPVRSRYAYRAKWCSERCRKAQYDFDPCVVCGGKTSSGPANGRVKDPRCDSCTRRHKRERELARQAVIERLWAEGKTAKQIGEVLGWNPRYAGNIIAVCRHRGYDLPVRNAGSSAWMRSNPEVGKKARDVWVAMRGAP